MNLNLRAKSGPAPVFLVAFFLGLEATAGGVENAERAGTSQETEGQVLRILTHRLPDGVVGRRYRINLAARGGQKPYSWTLNTPHLPEGWALEETTGQITGSPLSADLHDFTIQVTDSSQPPQTATAYFTLRVADRLVLYRRLLPKGVLRSQYRLQLQATGGTPPNRWELLGGTLPPGLRLDRRGRLQGSPRAAGEFRFTIRVSDSGRPAQTDTGLFVVGVVAPLTVEWKQLPRVERGGIYGSVVVSNGTKDNFDLTLIVVAVNEYGKAFALGYQRIVLEKESMSVEIPFGFSLPRGDYVVHVDAVAEVAPKNAIYRDRREQEGLRVE